MNVAIAIERGAAISAQPLDLVTDRRFTSHHETLRDKTIASGIFTNAKEMHLPDAPIAISAGDLSIWSQRMGTCGEVVRRGWWKGAMPYNKVGTWVWAHFNGF